MNWIMIPFTELPPVDQMTWLELYVRAALLGAVCALLLSPFIAAAFFWWHSR